MIYISSACCRFKTIKKSITAIAEAGFGNIELSGGTQYYAEYENDILRLQDKFNLNYQVHNYFPPPSKHFVLNLASLDENIQRQSVHLCKNAIKLSKKLGGKRYGIHAGFLIDFKPKEAGNKIDLREIYNSKKAITRFNEAWKEICGEADGEIDLYVENNVFSSTNFKTYSGNNPFLLSDYQGYIELKEQADINLLLDLAHLKVSTKSLGLDFDDEVRKMLPLTNYIHLSENDGFHDQNKKLEHDSNILNCLHDFDFANGTLVIEVYEGLEQVKSTYRVLQCFIHDIRKKSDSFI